MFFVASIGLAVLLMNIFIAVLGQNLELFQDQAAQLSLGHCSKYLLIFGSCSFDSVNQPRCGPQVMLH